MDRLTKVAGKAAVNGTETDVQVQYTYDRDRLTKITHNGFDYTFAYDGFGNRKSVSIAGKAAVSHDYEAKNGNLLKSTYANGWEVAYTYDNLDRVTEVKASKDGTSYTIGRYIYDKLGRVARFVDGQVSGKSCTYGYDLTDRLRLKKPLTSWADFHPSGETAGNIRQLIPMKQQRTADRQDG